MDPALVFLIIILVAAAVAIVYDVWLGRRGGGDATISWHVWTAAKRWPVIPLLTGLAVGVLFGHLFWSQCP